MSRARDIANFGDGIDTADIGDGQITTAKIADGDVTSAKLFSGFANGITYAEQFNLESDVTTNNTVISNWASINLTSNGKVGSGMSVSSGVFTFPSTGIYLINMQANMILQNSPVDSQVNMELDVSEDGTNFTTDEARAVAYNNESNIGTASNNYMLDVTDTSLIKVRFRSDSLAGTSIIRGSTTQAITSVTFIRLGDT